MPHRLLQQPKGSINPSLDNKPGVRRLIHGQSATHPKRLTNKLERGGEEIGHGAVHGQIPSICRARGVLQGMKGIYKGLLLGGGIGTDLPALPHPKQPLTLAAPARSNSGGSLPVPTSPPA